MRCPIRPGILAAVAVAATLAPWACSEDARPEATVWSTVQLTPVPESFVVIIQGPEGFLSLSCVDPREAEGSGPESGSSSQGGESPEVLCTDSGFQYDSELSPVGLSVKAPGFYSTQRSLLELAVQADGSRLFPLSALDDSQPEEDYVTLFPAQGGDELFEEFSFAMDTELGASRMLKFLIEDLGGTPKVYFQNTRKYPLHYEFAKKVLGFAGTATEFGAQTYVGEDRERMAGTLIYYPDVCPRVDWSEQPACDPFLVTFFPSDNLTPQQALWATRMLEERLGVASLSGSQRRVAYLPAGSYQEEQLEAETGLFDSWGIGWIRHSDLYDNITTQLLNPGLAFGTLRVWDPDDGNASVVSSKDILIVTRLPNELPLVAGTLTEEIQTPLAHVNVAARSRGTPNMTLLKASKHPDVAPYIGKLVRFEVANGRWSIAKATLEEATKYWNSQHTEPFVPEHDSSVGGLPGFQDLAFHDWNIVGVKAANLAEIHHVLPEQSPPGFAVPFHYYEAFMNLTPVTSASCQEASVDCRSEGRLSDLCDRALELCLQGSGQTLSAYVRQLVDHEDFQTQTELREASLDGLQYIISHAPIEETFALALDERMEAVFGNANARLRSSTNTEDLPDFSGAGLYTSVSASSSGPSAASRRIKTVWASVWSFKAFEEREYWNIDHFEVRMGICASLAYPDERANGVLITQNLADPSVLGQYVNVQLGELSVTNPVGGVLPEVFSILQGPGGALQVVRQRFSSLSPEKPILQDQEVAALREAAQILQNHFSTLYGLSPYVLALDIEFKFHGPERALVIKQARPYVD